MKNFLGEPMSREEILHSASSLKTRKLTKRKRDDRSPLILSQESTTKNLRADFDSVVKKQVEMSMVDSTAFNIGPDVSVEATESDLDEQKTVGNEKQPQKQLKQETDLLHLTLKELLPSTADSGTIKWCKIGHLWGSSNKVEVYWPGIRLPTTLINDHLDERVFNYLLQKFHFPPKPGQCLVYLYNFYEEGSKDQIKNFVVLRLDHLSSFSNSEYMNENGRRIAVVKNSMKQGKGRKGAKSIWTKKTIESYSKSLYELKTRFNRMRKLEKLKILTEEPSSSTQMTPTLSAETSTSSRIVPLENGGTEEPDSAVIEDRETVVDVERWLTNKGELQKRKSLQFQTIRKSATKVYSAVTNYVREYIETLGTSQTDIQELEPLCAPMKQPDKELEAAEDS